MIKVLLARLHQGHRTMRYPDGPPPEMPERFRGRPVFDAAKCPDGCSACADACPTEAIRINGKPQIDSLRSLTTAAEGPERAERVEGPQLDLGRCLFCTDCLESCPTDAVRYSKDYRLAVRQRSDLVIDPVQELRLATALNQKLMRLFGRSLKLREVCAGGCNGCESDVNVLNTVGWDLGRFGIQFVASPRHADGLLITGPVTRNMEPCAEEDVRRGPAAQDRDCRRGLCRLRRAVCRPRGSPQRGRQYRASGFVHSRMPAAPPDDPGWSPEATWQDRGTPRGELILQDPCKLEDPCVHHRSLVCLHGC
jgi:formate hydrogenlyase subunit 6/NADH:ubiquinone oxidoreductase subunit I